MRTAIIEFLSEVVMGPIRLFSLAVFTAFVVIAPPAAARQPAPASLVGVSSAPFWTGMTDWINGTKDTKATLDYIESTWPK